MASRVITQTIIAGTLLWTVSSKSARSLDEGPADTDLIPCGPITCDPTIQYCSQDIAGRWECLLCEGICARSRVGNNPQYIQECNSTCPIFWKLQLEKEATTTQENTPEASTTSTPTTYTAEPTIVLGLSLGLGIPLAISLTVNVIFAVVWFRGRQRESVLDYANKEGNNIPLLAGDDARTYNVDSQPAVQNGNLAVSQPYSAIAHDAAPNGAVTTARPPSHGKPSTHSGGINSDVGRTGLTTVDNSSLNRGQNGTNDLTSQSAQPHPRTGVVKPQIPTADKVSEAASPKERIESPTEGRDQTYVKDRLTASRDPDDTATEDQTYVKDQLSSCRDLDQTAKKEVDGNSHSIDGTTYDLISDRLGQLPDQTRSHNYPVEATEDNETERTVVAGGNGSMIMPEQPEKSNTFGSVPPDPNNKRSKKRAEQPIAPDGRTGSDRSRNPSGRRTERKVLRNNDDTDPKRVANGIVVTNEGDSS